MPGDAPFPPLDAPTVHASCVAIGREGVLIRGPSGAGKSALALRLILDAPRCLPLAELVADDRVALATEAGALVARPAPRLEGLIEVRGLGIRWLPHRPSVVLSYVVDLSGPGGAPARLPELDALTAVVSGHSLRRIAAPDGASGALLLAALLASAPYEN